MSIQEKRRLLISNESINSIGNALNNSRYPISISSSQNQNTISSKKRNRRSLANLDMLNNSTVCFFL